MSQGEFPSSKPWEMDDRGPRTMLEPVARTRPLTLSAPEDVLDSPVDGTASVVFVYNADEVGIGWSAVQPASVGAHGAVNPDDEELPFI